MLQFLRAFCRWLGVCLSIHAEVNLQLPFDIDQMPNRSTIPPFEKASYPRQKGSENSSSKVFTVFYSSDTKEVLKVELNVPSRWKV